MFQDSDDLPLIEPDFTGFYSHTLDSKGRMTIPSQFRDKPVNSLYVTKGLDGNLDVYTVPAFSHINAKLDKLNSADPDTRTIKRIILGGANKVDIDASGRILIPPIQRQYAQIESEVVIIGMGNYFEIWSPDKWAKQDLVNNLAMQNRDTFTHLDL